ncbi:MAG: hypothetical protein M1828_003628 [Chrysothrix sp. TS-e1954]|nr:MAG: hypothetical protein M1828_003628 [Chrysothrix sp. TS-e1954]
MDVSSMEERVPYWNTNLPRSEWTSECPAYLANVGDSDRNHLGVRDEEYDLLSWERVKELVRDNQLQLFTRVPSELRRYKKYMDQIKQDYGSTMNFILKERVKWKDTTPRGEPFEYPDDISILHNDWPYGIDPRIVHLVVWTKFSFDTDPERGDLTPESRKQIDEFVTKTFKRTSDDDSQVIWFKNWTSLMSVHSVVHFHVMLFDPDSAFVDRITNGDEALSKRISRDS